MAKLLFLILLALVVWGYFKASAAAAASRGKRAERPAAEAMVACARCGLHVPAGETVEHAGRRYCCHEHARQDERH